LAVKALANGMKGFKVDGNDFFAIQDALIAASEYTREGNGPVLIEAFTYRQGAHTTSDDPSKYRTRDEESAWAKKDPLKRMKAFLSGRNGWSEEEEKQRLKQYRKEITRQFEEAENHSVYTLEEVFAYMFGDMPEPLKQQKNRYEQFLNWKERQS
jgi:pyruvate dehydrogenase E1 component alpha subunit